MAAPPVGGNDRYLVLEQRTIQAVTQIPGISWDEAWHILDRAVERGLRRKPRRITPEIGVDEKSAGRGTELRDHRLCLKAGTVKVYEKFHRIMRKRKDRYGIA